MSKQIDKDSDKPLYVQLKEIVRAQLPKDKDHDVVRLPSERKLAEEHGVSRMTARQALKTLGEELAIQRNGQGTFYDKKATQSLDMVRFVFPKNWTSLSQSTFYSNIFHGAEEQANKHDCDLIFSTLSDRNQMLKKIKATDAIILVGETDKQTIKHITKTGCKLCLVDCDVGNKNGGWDQVVIDNAQGSEIAADVFIKHNHKKCAFIDSYLDPPSFAYKLRHSAFANTLRDNGIPFSDDDRFIMNYESIEENTQRVLDALINGGYTAAYASHSHFAIDLLENARKRKLDKQISLIGFGDDALTNKLKLNTICVPERTAGEIAIEQIVKSHNNGWCLKQNALISTHYVDRGSVHSA